MRPIHEPTESYYDIARNLDKCMMRADAFNLNVEHVRKEMTGTQYIPISHVCSSDGRESKEIIADKSKSKGIIAEKTLS